jgi:hypothetical protein
LPDREEFPLVFTAAPANIYDSKEYLFKWKTEIMFTMDTIQIKWVNNIPFDNIGENENKYLGMNGFYALLGARYDENDKTWKVTLLYIGQAFDQTFRERIPQDHPAYKCVFDYIKKNPEKEIRVMVGVIEKTDIEKTTQALFDDVECCLIYCNQPICNEQCKESYIGRDLQVVNTGSFIPLKENCTCKR